MPQISYFYTLALAGWFSFVGVGGLVAAEPVTLLGAIAKWRYPDAKIGQSEISDAMTINALGQRTVPSIMLKTTMTTKDSVTEVVTHYRKVLARKPENDAKVGISPGAGCSIIFSDDSDGDHELHTILVNAGTQSTTIIISRAKGESKTRVIWKQYRIQPLDG